MYNYYPARGNGKSADSLEKIIKEIDAAERERERELLEKFSAEGARGNDSRYIVVDIPDTPGYAIKIDREKFYSRLPLGALIKAFAELAETIGETIRIVADVLGGVSVELAEAVEEIAAAEDREDPPRLSELEQNKNTESRHGMKHPLYRMGFAPFKPGSALLCPFTKLKHGRPKDELF